MGYIICQDCGDFYELQPREHPEDFSSCHCGGKLRYERRMINDNYIAPKKRSEFKLPSLKNFKTLAIGTIVILIFLVKIAPKLLVIFFALFGF